LDKREGEKRKGDKTYASSLLCGNSLLVGLLAKSEVAQELRVHLHSGEDTGRRARGERM
jgi:hypothetical protein